MMTASRKCVVYTCITGGYDELLNHTYVSSKWDYVCFSDDLNIRNEKNDKWEVRPLSFEKLDDVRKQRWHKLHPHVLFPDHEISLWIDGNINVLDGSIFEDLDEAINKSYLISSSLHPDRDCVYDEYDVCGLMGKDNSEIMKRQEYLIRKDGFPKQMGLFETNVILRKHNDPLVIKIMRDWWFWLEQYSRRDQLSFTYVLWKNNYRIEPLSPVSYRKSPSVSFREGRYHITKEELIKQNEELLAKLNDVKNSMNLRMTELVKQNEELLVKLNDVKSSMNLRMTELIKQNGELLVKLSDIKSSMSWRITKPLRKISKSIRKRSRKIRQ